MFRKPSTFHLPGFIFLKVYAIFLKGFRFHDLGHYYASTLHAIGIPDPYIMERCGWGNDAVRKDVYRHTTGDIKEKP